MRLVLAALLLLAVAAGSSPAAAALDAPTIRYLEGIWLINHAPAEGVCADAPYGAYQMEFEFHKTGGRVLHYEPFDLFSVLPIAGGERNGDTISLTFDLPPAMPALRARLHILDADRLALTMTGGGDTAAPQKPDILYRCGAPDNSVTGDVPADILRLLTPVTNVGIGFIEALPGQSDQEVCWPKPPTGPGYHDTPNWIQFELFGPVHYYVFGQMEGASREVRDKLDLNRIASVRRTGAHSLRLEMRTHVGGLAWRGKGASEAFALDIGWSGHRIRVAQFNASFVRCGDVSPPADWRPPR